MSYYNQAIKLVLRHDIIDFEFSKFYFLFCWPYVLFDVMLTEIGQVLFCWARAAGGSPLRGIGSLKWGRGTG